MHECYLSEREREREGEEGGGSGWRGDRIGFIINL